MRVKISISFWVFSFVKRCPHCHVSCVKNIIVPMIELFIYADLKKKTSRCQKYLEISSFMLNFSKPLTKIFSVLFQNVYHCPTQSWHGGNAHRKTKHPQLFYEKFMS